MSAPTVQLRGAAKHYRGTAALAGIDLDLYQGVVGLLGPNGAGKTTLLRMLATVLAPTEGRLRLLGLDPAEPHERTDVRRSLGYLPQEMGFPSGFSAFRFVDYMAVLKEWDDPAQRRAEVRRVLEQVDLGDRSTKRIRALSGGQRRRVGLAQALIGTPELLVLDEPTNGLDPQGISEIRELLLDLHRGGTTIFLSSHLLTEVEQLCSRVGVLDRGRLVLQDRIATLVAPTGSTVVHSPTPDRVRALLDGRVSAIEGDRLVVRGSDPAEVNALLVGAGIPVTGLALDRPTLEQVVLAAAGTSSDRVEVRR